MAKPVKHFGKWRIRWIDEHGVRRSETYENYKDAQFSLLRHEGRVAEVKRGFRSSIALDKTFDELCDYYLAYRTTQKRRRRDDESLIRVHLRPFFGKLKLTEAVQKLDEYKTSRSHYHPNSLNHQLTLLISMLRVAYEKKWLSEVPIIKKPQVRVLNKDFQYLKTDEEIQRLLRSAESEGLRVFTAYAVSIYTGIRPGELAGLRVTDLFLDRRQICIQRSYNAPTKNGEIRYVPILDPLLPILKQWIMNCEGPLLFPNEAGNILDPRARLFCEIFHRVLEHAGFPRVERHGKLSSYIRYYDLRHTFASHWMTNNGNLFKLSKILGHRNIQMTMRYAHLEPDAFSEDYGRLGQRVLYGLPGGERCQIA